MVSRSARAGPNAPLLAHHTGGLSQVPNPRLKGVPVADVRLRRAAARARRIARRRLRQPDAHADGRHLDAGANLDRPSHLDCSSDLDA